MCHARRNKNSFFVVHQAEDRRVGADAEGRLELGRITDGRPHNFSLVGQSHDPQNIFWIRYRRTGHLSV